MSCAQFSSPQVDLIGSRLNKATVATDTPEDYFVPEGWRWTIFFWNHDTDEPPGMDGLRFVFWACRANAELLRHPNWACKRDSYPKPSDGCFRPGNPSGVCLNQQNWIFGQRCADTRLQVEILCSLNLRRVEF